jgi:uncharacterized protein with PIN domain
MCEPRFMVDAMLGRLARWLRYLGYDAAYEAGIRDAALVRRARGEKRIVLTRDRELLERWRLDRTVLVRSDQPLSQLRQVVDELKLPVTQPATRRCTVCNESLIAASPERVEGDIPPYVRDHHTEFARCPTCRRVYWEGTHAARMHDTLSRALS